MNRLSFRHVSAGLLAVLFVVSTIIVLTNSVQNQFFYGGAFAGVLFAILIIDTWRALYGWQNTLFLFVASYTLITLIVILSFYYGWPLGTFQYTELLGYELNDIVPWTVPIVWIAFIAVSLPLTRKRMIRKKKNRAYLFTWAFDSAILVTLLDIAIEPAMTGIGLKLYQPTQGIYGVPFQHFLGFFIVSFLLSSIVIARTHTYTPEPSVSRLFSTCTALLLLFFAVLSGTLQLPIPFILGILLAVWIIWRQRQTEYGAA